MLKKTGKTQAWLSAATGINAAMISQICSGRSLPTPGELYLIRLMLKCRREDLYDPLALQLIDGVEPKPKKEKKTKTVRLTLEIVKIVDRFASMYDISRDEAARTMILYGSPALGYWYPKNYVKKSPPIIHSPMLYSGVDYADPRGSQTLMIPTLYTGRRDEQEGGEETCHDHA